MKRSFFAILAAIAAAAASLFASQVCYEDTGLDAVVRRSEIIAVVTRADPVYTVRDIKMDGVNVRELGKPVPPFTLRTYHFKLVEVVTNRSEMKLGATLNVLEPDWELEMELHRRWYTERMSKSPILERYPSKVDIHSVSNKTEKLIVFLRPGEGGTNLVFTVERSYDRASLKSEVLRLLSEKAAASDRP